jgi:hypothetical protein
MPGQVIAPGAAKSATASVTALPSGQTYTGNVFITSDSAGLTQVAAGPTVTFVATGASQNVGPMSYTAPSTFNAAGGSAGNWWGWVVISLGGVPIVVSSGAQGVAITLGQVTINSVQWN